MTDYMKEAERLMRQYDDACLSIIDMSEEQARAALLAHIQRGAVPEGDDGKRVLREVFALCEDTETKCSDETGDFARGRRFEAKGIARATGAWYQEEFCGRTRMGEPAPAPDHFRDAAEMVPMPDTTDIAGYTPQALRDYGDAREAAGYARGLKEAGRDGYASGYNDGIRTAALRGEVKP